MSCHSSTDKPHAVPRDAATVPTITMAATTLQGDQQHDRENQDHRGDDHDHQVGFDAVLHIAVKRCRAGERNLRVGQQGALECVCDNTFEILDMYVPSTEAGSP